MVDLLAGPVTERTLILLTPDLKAEAQRQARAKKISLGKMIRLALADVLRPQVGRGPR